MAKKEFKTNPAMQFISAPEEEKATPKKTAKKEEPATALTAPAGYVLKRESKSERMQLLVRPTTKQALKKLADDKGISVNDLANTIFDEYIERQGK